MIRSGSIQRKTLRVTYALAVAALLAGLAPAETRAQATSPAPGQAAPAAAAAASPAPATPQQGSDSVASRVGKLEGQISDLQVMNGTLESLLREKPGATLQHEASNKSAGSSPRSRHGSVRTHRTLRSIRTTSSPATRNTGSARCITRAAIIRARPTPI
ncbi:MAG: hypothetical protein ACAH04_01145 [Methylibium sp.]